MANSQILDSSQHEGPGPCIHYPPKQGDPVLHQVLGSHFIATCRSQESYCNLDPRRNPYFTEAEVLLNRRSVGQSVFVLGTHLMPMNRVLLLSGSCRFVDVGHPF
jgi:hypothetical protein